jgi:hypothetical protein
VLLQEDDGKEFPVAYVSRQLSNAETRYTSIERLCLTFCFTCTKFRHYILSSTCTIACQYDIVRHMLHSPLLSGRLGKWAYALVEYDLTFEPLRSLRGQIVADFMVDHVVATNTDVQVLEKELWVLYFDGSVCDKGRGLGCVIVSPHGKSFDLAVRLEFPCSNNQAEYEALLYGLEYL